MPAQNKPSFDYSVWTPDTSVTLCSVSWDNSYRDVVKFRDESARDAYFAGLDSLATIKLDGFVYLRYGEPVRVSVPFSACNRCNYLVVRNRVQPVPSPGGVRTPDVFYYFVNDIRYIAPNTTELVIQLDVWTTYINRVELGQCYVERGHIGIANSNATMANLADYLLEPEGLEIGTDYRTAAVDGKSFQNDPAAIVIVSSTSLKGSFGSKDNPSLSTSNGEINTGIPSGCNVYVVEGSRFVDLMGALSNAPWVSQCIQQIIIVPWYVIDDSIGSDVFNIAGNVPARGIQYQPVAKKIAYHLNDARAKFGMPARYAGLLKFYTAPFTTIEMTNYQGSTLNFSLGELKTANEVIVTLETCVAPPYVRAYAYPEGYLADSGNHFTADVRGVHGETFQAVVKPSAQLEGALLYDGFPQCSVVNNQYINYLASNVHGLSYQRQAASWAQEKAIMGNQLAYNQSTFGTNIAMSNALNANDAAWGMNDIANQKVAWGAATGAVGSLVSGAASGTVAGAAAGVGNAALNVANAGMTQAWNNQSTGISTSLAMSQAQNARSQSLYNRDTNYDYANYAAKGDYGMSIAAIQAKVSDAALTPPTVSGTQGGDAFAVAKGYSGIWLKFKRPAMHFVRQVGEYWLRYGYAINRFIMSPPMECMTNFTYYKMQFCSVFGELPEQHRNAIRGIFESGVTVWSDPSKVNRIDVADNKALEGVSY